MLKRVLAACVAVWVAGSAAADPAFWSKEFPKTDFSRAAVGGWDEIVSGGPGRDGIPALSAPGFRPASRESRLTGREPVILLDLGGETRIYPIRYLTWHEIVNDTVAGIPVAVTFCPLCNSAMVFDRRVAGEVLEFGVTGKLRHSDMVMYDRQSESWWQQAVGEGIVGRFTGTRLRQIPSRMESWSAARAAHPQARVMEKPGHGRDYGRNPYVGYDSAARPFLYRGETPPHGIPPLARVVRVGDRAWPLTRLRAAGRIAEAGVTIAWSAGQASALDSAAIGQGRDVGSIRVTDAAGRDVAHDVLFAFAFHAFWPDGTWMLGGG